jgi:hypothetical protein
MSRLFGRRDYEDDYEDESPQASYYGTDGRPRVLSDQCSTCIGRPGNLMKLNPGRVKGMVQSAVTSGGGIICHQTLPYGDHPDFGGALCRWFYDHYGHLSNGIRIAERLGGLAEVDPPADDEEEEQEAG